MFIIQPRARCANHARPWPVPRGERWRQPRICNPADRELPSGPRRPAATLFADGLPGRYRRGRPGQAPPVRARNDTPSIALR